MFNISVDGGKAKVSSPYNPDFISKVKALGGKWSASDKTWVVSREIIDDVRAVMRDVYGRDDISSADTADVIVTFNRDADKYRGPIVLFGKVIASAFGRDSGARVGDGVSFLKGKPESGGSMKNWRTSIPSDSVVKIPDVPKVLIEGFSRDTCEYDISIQVNNRGIDKKSLLAEKDRLMKRIAEIDSILQKAG